MGIYDFQQIEKKWQLAWNTNRTFVADKLSDKPKYYVLDMFPYPSGAGLHVGHPLGYIATDIITRYKRAKGYNVLHPMGFDSFGLPAEQYAIDTGIHPAETTQKNITRYLQQMATLGFHYDPDANLSTSDPDYYKWTQWIFLKLFSHWYDKAQEKARPIEELTQYLAQHGNRGLVAATSWKKKFSAQDWNAMSPAQQSDRLMHYRIAYLDYATVNWCPALGTVLANEEIKDGKSERGGHPVERKKMKQWMLRITAYADRLLSGLETIDWSESMKSMQTHWIGRSEGAHVEFGVEGSPDKLEVFTTRPDTLFGVSFMVVAPEHGIVDNITTPEQRAAVSEYVAWAKNRSEVDRMADNNKTGVFTGGYAINPVNGAKVPIWISDYVVISYGTGAIMAVPAGDQRDWEFAKKFGLEIPKITEDGDIEVEAYDSKESKMVNSGFLDGMTGHQAIKAMIAWLEEQELGQKEVTYRQRDVIWSRQRYWGEPTPIAYTPDGVAVAIPESELPLTLPEIDEYKPSADGQPPLARAQDWVTRPDGSTRDLNTMPGLAGSSWYFLRYPDAQNPDAFADQEKLKYWLPVDLYVGGTEHAVGHLMYSRFWTKFLFDINECPVEEPFQRLVNQGMIQGTSQLMYRHKESNEFVSADLVENADDYVQIHTNVNLVKHGVLDLDGYRAWRSQEQVVFRSNDKGEFRTVPLAEMMSKSKFNTVDPDDICREYGADTMRMYEMFLGPIDIAKPWNTDGISGVHSFLRRAWNLFVDFDNNLNVTSDAPTKEELKLLHQCIKQVEDSIERLAFNVCVPAFMVLVKELTRIECRKREILEPLLVTLAPFAPHFSEELWAMLGHEETILKAAFPQWKEEYLKEDEIEIPVQINGKLRSKILIPSEAEDQAVEAIAMADEKVLSWIEGKTIRKVIVVKGRMINIVAN